jgi:hypothetical protein
VLVEKYGDSFDGILGITLMEEEGMVGSQDLETCAPLGRHTCT